MCGFDGLDQGEIIARAAEILDSTELKQAVCQRILGASHKDIEKAMHSVLNDRSEKSEEAVLPRQSTIDAIVPKKQKKSQDKPKYRNYSYDEVQCLIEASKTSIKPNVEPSTNLHYPTYSIEEASQMVIEHVGYKESEKLKEDSLDGHERRRTHKTQEPPL